MPITVKFRSLLLATTLALATLLGSCCLPDFGSFGGPTFFDDSKPYALVVRQFRSLLHAQKLRSRLQDMGLKPYIIHAGTEDEGGSWFKVLVGAEVDDIGIRDLRHTLEVEHDVTDVEIIQYTDFLDSLTIDPDPELYAEPRVAGNRPQVPEVLWDTMALYPVSNLFNVDSMSILASPTDPEDGRRYLSSFSSIKLDLPRGISKKHLRKVCESVSEVILKDNLFDDQVTINILKMRLNHGVTGDLADHFADLVLDTGEYSTEEKVPFEVSANEQLSGYKVVIEPKPDYFRTYIILANPGDEWVYFSQSTDKTPEEMVSVLELIGKSEGMMEYAEFYNTFHSIPDRLLPEDIFVGFKLDEISRSWARNHGNPRWAKACVGHWKANGYFNHEKKGSYSYGVFDLMSADKVSWVHADYSRRNRGLSTVDVYGTKGKAATTERWNKRKWEYYKVTSEVNWTADRYIVMINNSKNSWLGRKDLIARGNALQLNRIGAYAWDTGEEGL